MKFPVRFINKTTGKRITPMPGEKKSVQRPGSCFGRISNATFAAVNENRFARLFIRTAGITLALLYLVILAGSVVRATGSGMGCPDWPKCFGQYIPPTDISQLPPDYKERFKVEGKTIDDFNAVHTWTEYINRLAGALSGASMFVMGVLSLFFWKKDKRVTLLLLFAAVLLAFVGWMGKVVVDSNLHPLMITMHFASALALVAVTIYTLFRIRNIVGFGSQQAVSGNVSWLLLAAFLLTLVQVIIGTQVRQNVDVVHDAMNNTHRETWIQQLGPVFSVHWVMALPVLILNALLFIRLRRLPLAPLYKRLSVLMFGALLAEYLLGIFLSKFGIPAFAQPIHLFLATIVFGLQFALLVNLPVERKS